MSKSNRNSSIELLKIIAAFLIVLSHSLPCLGNGEWYVDIHNASGRPYNIALVVFNYCGQVGNVIFVICSSYYLIENNNLKANKIYSIVIDTLAISWSSLIIVLLLGITPSIHLVIDAILPITTETYWFITAFIFFLIIQPLLNKLLHNTNKTQILKAIGFQVIVYMFLGLIVPIAGHCYFSSNLQSFITIYFIVYYLKTNSITIKKPFVILTSAIILLLLEIVLTDFIGMHIEKLNNQMTHWLTIMNPIILVIGLCLFQVFFEKNYNKAIINNISSYTLLIYLIGSNELYSVYIRPRYFDFVYNRFQHVTLFHVILLGVIQFALAIALSVIYNSIASNKSKLVNVISKVIDGFFNGLVRRFDK